MSTIQGQAAQVAARTRHHGANDARTLDARRGLAPLTIERAIERALASAPPLSDEQADRLAAMLRGAGPEGTTS